MIQNNISSTTKRVRMKNFKKGSSFFLVGATLVTSIAAGTSAQALPGTNGFRYNSDGSINCVENGWHFQSEDGYAPASHCFNTWVDSENLPNPLAEVNPKLTEQDLINVENTSALNPKNYVGRDTFAYKKLTGNEPTSPMSTVMTNDFQESNFQFNRWNTGDNAGWGYASNENIPIYSVDSSNPNQNFVYVDSKDPRATTVSGYEKIMKGKIPLPTWALKDRGWSGDHSIAIYDKATGIWRSMFYFIPVDDDRDGVQDTVDGLPHFRYSSGGYILGKKDFQGLGDENYWLTLMGSTSSVVGMANELTQIGVDEIRAGKINHAISITAADYGNMISSSFPAKLADGRVNMIASEGDTKLLDGTEKAKRYRVSRFQSGKIDISLNNSYRSSMTRLSDLGLIKLNPDFSIVSSVIDVNTDTNKLGSEKGLGTADRNHINNFKKYLSEGDELRVSEAPMPYIPKAGQRFTIPKDIDVDEIADKQGMSEFDRMRLHAIQDYGGILTDRNAFVHSFNLEPAAGYAPYARLGKNVYKEDPEIVEKLKGSNAHLFPWQDMVWIDAGYAEKIGDNDVKDSSKSFFSSIPEGSMKGHMYYPDSYNEQTYQGQATYVNYSKMTVLPEDVTFHAPWHEAVLDQSSGKVEQALPKVLRYTPKDDYTGTTKVANLNTIGYLISDGKPIDNRFIEFGKYDVTKASAGTHNALDIIVKKDLTPKFRSDVYITVVPKDKPIARTDIVRVVSGGETTYDVLANDEAFFGQKAQKRTAEQYDSSWGTFVLVDDSGKEVNSITTDTMTYKVENNKLKVIAKGVKGDSPEGIPALLKYKVKSNGKTSEVGTIETQVFNSFSTEALPKGERNKAEEPKPSEPIKTPEPIVTPPAPVKTPEPTTPAPVSDSFKYKDVPENHVFYKEIMSLTEKGIMKGWEDGTFRPYDSTSRGAMAAFFYRLAGSPEFNAPATPSFKDVPKTHQFYKEIEWMKASGLANGWSDGTYRPESDVSREAMAAFFYRFNGSPEYSAPSKSNFKDVAPTDVFYKEISWLKDKKISNGWKDGTYRPGTSITREAMAAFIYRYQEL